jgi:hypothetical protein
MVLIYRFKSIDGQYAEMEGRLTNTSSLMDGIVRQQTAILLQLDRMEGELSSVQEQVRKVAEKLPVISVNPAALPAPVSGPGEPQTHGTLDVTMPPDAALAMRDQVLQRDMTKRGMGKRNRKSVAKTRVRLGNAMPQSISPTSPPSSLTSPPPDAGSSTSEFGKYLDSIEKPVGRPPVRGQRRRANESIATARSRWGTAR